MKSPSRESPDNNEPAIEQAPQPKAELQGRIKKLELLSGDWRDGDFNWNFSFGCETRSGEVRLSSCSLARCFAIILAHRIAVNQPVHGIMRAHGPARVPC